MRRAVEGLATPHPLGRQLPAIYAADDFAQRLLAGLDTVVAPVYATLDTLWAYLDPRLAPADFVDWLGGWVAADMVAGSAADAADAADSPAARREAVRRAVELHRVRGTGWGLAEQLRTAFGVTAEVVDSGGTTWSPTPGADLPGSPEPSMTVRVRPAGGDVVPVARLRELIEANRPAHVTYTVEILPAAPEDAAPDPR
jgi:phage tail-like protein